MLGFIQQYDLIILAVNFVEKGDDSVRNGCAQFTAEFLLLDIKDKKLVI